MWEPDEEVWGDKESRTFGSFREGCDNPKDYDDLFGCGGYLFISEAYTYECYEGDGVVYLWKDDKFYELEGSHCSCYGLSVGEPVETNVEALVRTIKSNSWRRDGDLKRAAKVCLAMMQDVEDACAAGES